MFEYELSARNRVAAYYFQTSKKENTTYRTTPKKKSIWKQQEYSITGTWSNLNCHDEHSIYNKRSKTIAKDIGDILLDEEDYFFPFSFFCQLPT